MSKNLDARRNKTFTAEDVRAFAELSGDTNPIHLDEEYAAKTPFGRCIVHGKLVESLISAVLGTQLPGPMCAFKSSNIQYLYPVFIGDPVTAEVFVTGHGSKAHHVDLFVAAYTYYDDPERRKLVISGQATVTLPKDKVMWV